VPGTVPLTLFRWHNHLNPGIEKKGWSKLEEELMFSLHKLHGNKWTIIA
jgi:myb proto-oncogene protein